MESTQLMESLLRQMDPTDNEIQVIRAESQAPGEALSQILLKWLNQTRRSASINGLLDALKAVEERYALDTIKDNVVKSGKFIYQKATAEPGMMTLIFDTSTEETEAGESLWVQVFYMVNSEQPELSRSLSEKKKKLHQA